MSNQLADSSVQRPLLERIDESLGKTNYSLLAIDRLLDRLAGVIEDRPGATCGGCAETSPKPITTLEVIATNSYENSLYADNLVNRLAALLDRLN
jgi:hypothetical protein